MHPLVTHDLRAGNEQCNTRDNLSTPAIGKQASLD